MAARSSSAHSARRVGQQLARGRCGEPGPAQPLVSERLPVAGGEPAGDGEELLRDGLLHP
ncbi:hypothetical protein LUX57_04060 [Actinomadura madurae]|uniref:hypothetical protein n=1 Tax=Actinomadura madurae TaxID=1993 RepID=UPI0020D228E8|nr:hypothetical protein [Actinomadura madurae]MCP9964441.1 hypothetical protein [Actinomadura madurae]